MHRNLNVGSIAEMHWKEKNRKDLSSSDPSGLKNVWRYWSDDDEPHQEPMMDMQSMIELLAELEKRDDEKAYLDHLQSCLFQLIKAEAEE